MATPACVSKLLYHLLPWDSLPSQNSPEDVNAILPQTTLQCQSFNKSICEDVNGIVMKSSQNKMMSVQVCGDCIIMSKQWEMICKLHCY